VWKHDRIKLLNQRNNFILIFLVKLIVALFSLLILFISLNVEDLNAQNRLGILYLSNGSIQEFLFIGANTDSPLSSKRIIVRQGDKSIEYDVWDFKKIEFIAPLSGNILVHTNDSEILRYSSCSTKRNTIRGESNISFTILDNVTGQRKSITHAPGRTLKAIEFDVGPGPEGFMVNPRTNSQFPIYYKYDPYTGDKLEPQPVSGQGN